MSVFPYFPSFLIHASNFDPQMLKYLLKKVDKPADFVGQELSKKLMFMIFTIGYTLSIVAGYSLKDLKYTFYIASFSFALAFFLCVPSWPIYRKNPPKFVSSKQKME